MITEHLRPVDLCVLQRFHLQRLQAAAGIVGDTFYRNNLNVSLQQLSHQIFLHLEKQWKSDVMLQKRGTTVYHQNPRNVAASPPSIWVPPVWRYPLCSTCSAAAASPWPGWKLGPRALCWTGVHTTSCWIDSGAWQQKRPAISEEVWWAADFSDFLWVCNYWPCFCSVFLKQISCNMRVLC